MCLGVMCVSRCDVCMCIGVMYVCVYLCVYI